MNMTGLNVRKISNKLLIENLSQVPKRTFYMQGYFSSYPNDLAICSARYAIVIRIAFLLKFRSITMTRDVVNVL